MRFFRFLPFFTLIFIMASCTPIIENDADEIRNNSWIASLKSGQRVSLGFKGDNASFKILSKNKNENVDISGLCLTDAKKIMIFDKEDKENYCFKYKLKDNKLILNYDSGKLTLTKLT